MTAKTTLVVMAAGMGSRYGGLKQIDPVGPHDATILDYAVYDALNAGFDKVVFVITKHIEDAFHERFGRTIEKHCETAYAFQSLDNLPAGFALPPERQKPWGTAHAVLGCKDVITTPFAVINADDFYGRSAFRALHTFLQNVPERTASSVSNYCMIGYVLKNTLTEHGYVSRGVCRVDAHGFLQEINERTHIERAPSAEIGDTDARFTEDGINWQPLAGDSTVSMNIWGFTLDLFDEIVAHFPTFLQENQDNLLKAEFYLPNLVGDLIAEGQARVKVLTTDAKWFGITYQQDKARVERAIQTLIAEGVYPEQLWV